MNEKLYAKLEAQDWEKVVAKLTLAAKRQLVLCGMPREADGGAYCPTGTQPMEYAMEAMVKVYEGCITGENRWDPTRGDLYPFLERLVRRLVTDDKKKYSKRSLPISYETLDSDPADEQVSTIHLNALFESAELDVQQLITAVRENASDDGSIKWAEVGRALAISKHEMKKRREKLASLMEKHGLLDPPSRDTATGRKF